MQVFFLNSLSTMEQCEDVTTAERVFKNVVDCFKYLRPMLDEEQCVLIFDWRVEERGLIAGQRFFSVLDGLPQDDRTLYRIFKNNRSNDNSGSGVSVKVAPTDTRTGRLHGEIAAEGFNSSAIWISFGGHLVCESPKLVVRSPRDEVKVNNAHDHPSFIVLLPRYEASDKHRKEPYTDARGNRVAAMPYTPKRALHLLLGSVIHDRDRWAFDRKCSAFVRFKPTREELQIFHGFVVDEAEVPNEVRKKLKQ